MIGMRATLFPYLISVIFYVYTLLNDVFPVPQIGCQLRAQLNCLCYHKHGIKNEFLLRQPLRYYGHDMNDQLKIFFCYQLRKKDIFREGGAHVPVITIVVVRKLGA